MVISEQDRNDLHNGLAEVLGAQRAAVLMEHLPPVGWGDVATKRDLEHTESLLRNEFRSGLSELKADLTKTFVLSMVTANLTLVVVVLGYVQAVLK